MNAYSLVPRTLSSLVVAVAVAVVAPVATAQVPTIQNTFDAGSTEGWIATSAVAFNAPLTGGNPGGYLFVDNSESLVCYLRAPAAYRGDLRSYLGGSLSFDGRLIGTGGSPWMSAQDYGHVFLVSGATQIVADFAPSVPSAVAFTTYSMPLLAANWGVSDAAFQAVLANVTELRISVEALFGNESHGIDNIVLAPSATPASVATFGLGCGASALAAQTLPWIGTTFQASATSLPSPAFVVDVLGLHPVVPALPLANVFAQALPGCDLHVFPDVLEVPFIATGMASTQVVLPNTIGIVGGMFYEQIVPLQVDAQLQLVHVEATNALVMTIGAY